MKQILSPPVNLLNLLPESAVSILGFRSRRSHIEGEGRRFRVGLIDII